MNLSCLIIITHKFWRDRDRETSKGAQEEEEEEEERGFGLMEAEALATTDGGDEEAAPKQDVNSSSPTSLFPPFCSSLFRSIVFQTSCSSCGIDA